MRLDTILSSKIWHPNWENHMRPYVIEFYFKTWPIIKSLLGSFHYFFFVFWSKWPKNKNFSSHFQAKCGFLYTENKQTGQLIFSFLVTFDQKRKNEKWNEPDTCLFISLFICLFILDLWELFMNPTHVFSLVCLFVYSFWIYESFFRLTKLITLKVQIF